MTAPIPLESRRDAPTSKLLLTLGTAGAVAGLAIVFVFRGTQPTIARYKAEQLRLAVQEVLQQPDRFDTLYVVDGALTADRPTGAIEAYEKVFMGFRGADRVGYAINAGQPGFQDVIELIFGYEPERQSVLGMKVLESKETPGLGDKIEKDEAFVSQFNGAVTPLVPIKPREATGDPHEVDMITGATISSRTVIRSINAALEQYSPLIAAYREPGGQ